MTDFDCRLAQSAENPMLLSGLSGWHQWNIRSGNFVVWARYGAEPEIHGAGKMVDIGIGRRAASAATGFRPDVCWPAPGKECLAVASGARAHLDLLCNRKVRRQSIQQLSINSEKWLSAGSSNMDQKRNMTHMHRSVEPN
jgi:hypothetical protein